MRAPQRTANVLTKGDVAPGQQVMIVGASGGVGTYAVQLAKAFGAEVTGVCSTAKTDLVRAIGADHVIGCTQADFTDGRRQYDLIIDVGGNRRLSHLRRALAPNGTLVIVGGESKGRWTGGFGRSLRASVLSLVVRQRLAMLVSDEGYESLETVTELIEAGGVSPCIDGEHRVAQSDEAMRLLGEVRLECGLGLGVVVHGARMHLHRGLTKW